MKNAMNAKINSTAHRWYKMITQKHKILSLLFANVFLIVFIWQGQDILPFRYQKTKCLEETSKLDSKLRNSVEATEMTPTPEDTLCLLWNWPWQTHFRIDNCSQYGFFGITLSANRSLYSTVDAVIIHHGDIMFFPQDLPKQQRPFFQHWVWFNIEAPLNAQNLKVADNLFNLTMTFRQDSDIYIPYGQLLIRKEIQNVTVPRKSKLVAWAVTKWYAGALRNAYYEELRKHISIDVYGARHMPLSTKDFHSTISQYKFYLAFENSVYKDYITEKVWSNAFGSWAIPVVLGTPRKNYERFIPGDAFIHVDDFPSPKELANYLLELDKDDVKYQKYFNWRSKYYVKIYDEWPYFYCKGCSYIKHMPKYQVIDKISDWFLKHV